MLAMRLTVRSFLSSVGLAVLRTRQSLSKHTCHWLPPSSTAAPSWVNCFGGASLKKMRPGRDLTGCSDDDDDDEEVLKKG
jgi:hypothetical protein